jgi:hypothetical protein
MLNKLLYRYKKDPALPVVGKKEDLIQVMLKFWINQQKPNPCFKLFQIAQKNNVILSLESIGYILDACYLFDRKEPVAGLELVEPVAVKMVENGSSWKYLELLLIFYSRYASIEHVLSTWDQLVKHSFEHEDLDPRTTSAVLYAFGFTNERTKAIELIKSIPNKSPEILNSFMNGFLDQNDDIEAVTFAVQDIRQQLNF